MTAIGSLFTGCGGIDLGVLSALGPDARIAWHCEVDRWASTVLHRHFDGPNLGDVAAVDWSTVEPVDGLIGGPPCQPISVAGRRKGAADVRWLWPEAFRAMAELRPGWCLWENPTGLMTGRMDDDEQEVDGDVAGDMDRQAMGGGAVQPSWFGGVLGAMADLGYDCRWTVLRSSDVGAPHRRGRVFIAAFDTDRLGREGAGAGAWRDVGGGRGAAPDTDGERAGRDGRRLPGTAPRRPQVDVHAPVDDRAGTAVALRVLELRCAARDRCREERHRHLGGEVAAGRWGKYATAVARWEHAFGEPAPGPRDDNGRLHQDLPRHMLGFPAGWLDGLPRTAALRCAGNAAQAQVVELAARMLLGAP